MAGRAEEGSNRLSTCVHGVIITPRNFVISTLFLSLRVEFLALDLIGAEVRKVHEGFGKLGLKSDKRGCPTSKLRLRDEIATHQWSKWGQFIFTDRRRVSTLGMLKEFDCWNEDETSAWG